MLIALIGLTALQLSDHCAQVTAKTGLNEARCERLSENTKGEVAVCTTEKGAKLRLFKTPADCENALRARASALPQIESGPGIKRVIPTH